MQTITTIGLDIAKSVFQVHGVDADGNVVVRRQLKRRYVLAFFQKLPSCLVGIEACASSHYWSREFQALGHTVRLMPPAYVKPYVKRQKNDAADAEPICEAVTRRNMRFVPTKTPEQQSCLMLHRTRHLFIRQHSHHQFHPSAPGRVRDRRTCRAPWRRAAAQSRRRCQRHSAPRDSPGLRRCSWDSIAGPESPDPGLRSPRSGGAAGARALRTSPSLRP
jgi:Transposase